MKKALFCFFLQACLTLSGAERVALVIGNNDYAYGHKLKACVNDASDMAAVLPSLGFEVTLLKNASLSQIRRAVDSFTRSAASAEVALIYYSGHGLLVADEWRRDVTFNYLIPVDAGFESFHDVELKAKAVSVQSILTALDSAGAKCKLVFLDSCQNNGLASGKAMDLISKGAVVEGVLPKETFLVTAASPGTTAPDGVRNSPFTSMLLKRLNTPSASEPLSFLFAAVARDVNDQFKEKLRPVIQSNLTDRFIRLALKVKAEAPAPPQNPEPLSLTMSTDKTVYHDRELMRITVTANRDAFVRLIYQSADGAETILLPNEAHNGKVKGGSAVVFGDETVINPQTGKAFRIRIGPPFGREVLSAVASDRPLVSKGAKVETIDPVGSVAAGARGSVARTEIVTGP